MASVSSQSKPSYQLLTHNNYSACINECGTELNGFDGCKQYVASTSLQYDQCRVQRLQIHYIDNGIEQQAQCSLRRRSTTDDDYDDDGDDGGQEHITDREVGR